MPTQLEDDLTAKFGVPVVLNRHVPRGTAYLVHPPHGSQMMVFGTWTPPLPSVRAIVASQRRRRHR